MIGGGYDSCYYVRLMHPMIYNGWKGDRLSLRTSRVDNETMFNEAIKADVIVFHRPIDRRMLEAAKLLKEFGKVVVMDNDDTYVKDSGVPTQMFGDLNEKLKKAVDNIDVILKEFGSLADLVTVSTEFLKEEYKQVNENVVVLPNCIDPLDWRAPKRNEGNKVRIGIVGSVASNQDYKTIIPLLDELKKRDDVQIVLFALPHKSKETEWATRMYTPEFNFWDQYNPEWTPFCQIQDYMDTLNNLKLDLMLIPRHDNYFNRAKSNIKFLESSMCAVPVIAQGFPDNQSPYQVDKEDTEHMIIATDSKDWITKTIDLVDNKEKREELGQRARAYIINKYNIKANAHKWKEAYQKIWNQKNKKQVTNDLKR